MTDAAGREPVPVLRGRGEAHRRQCGVFAEFVLLLGGSREGGEWRRNVEARAAGSKRRGWKRSASLLVVVPASRGGGMTEWEDDPAGCAVWNHPALTNPVVIPLPGGGTVVVKAFGVKQDPAHTLTTAPASP